MTQTVEVESPETGQALAEARAKSAALTEQLLVQRQLLRELETQLHESQRSCTQLRTQVAPPPPPGDPLPAPAVTLPLPSGRPSSPSCPQLSLAG